MRRPFKYWRHNRRFSGFSFGQLIGIYALAFAMRKGVTDDELRGPLLRCYPHRTSDELELMISAAQSMNGSGSWLKISA